LARRVFYSFHFDNDNWRTQQVRHIGAIEGNRSATPNDWEAVKRRGEAAIRKWIDDSMHGRSCTIVLVGAHTANRPWINYEIAESHRLGMGLLGIRIHKLLDSKGEPCWPGPNPFDYVSTNGRALSNRYPLYDPPGYMGKDAYAQIEANIGNWIEKALR
jgi:hypothetical protein